MESTDAETVKRDQKALDNYQESRKRQRSYCGSPSDSILDSPKVKKEKTDDSLDASDSVWHIDPEGLYGLKPEYLRILGIEPPICNWVYVENFRCDKIELREALELAGHVVVCSVIYAQPKHAKVMYSHPLEAVQAISMLNKQIFFGSPLSVKMLNYPLGSVILPRSLPEIGPGFGAYGKPLRDIVKHYERFINKEPHTLNTLLFFDRNDPKDVEEIKEAMSSVSSEVTGSEKKEDIYKRFNFSKQFSIKYIEDIGEDSKIDTDVKKESWGTDVAVRKTTPPSYSPDSPTRSPAIAENNRTNRKPIEVVTSEQKFSSNNIRPMNLSGPMAGPSYGPVGPTAPVHLQNNSHNNILPTPVAQRAMISSNIGLANVGPRFVPNPMSQHAYGNNGSMTVPEYRSSAPMVMPNGPGIRPSAPMVVPNGPGIRPNAPLAGPNPIPAAVVPAMRPSGPIMPASSYCTVQFRNLPPTTTFQILCDKMSQCGQVMSVQLTTPGCATVSFSQSAHAQNCFQRFNNLCVDGCVIQARIV